MFSCANYVDDLESEKILRLTLDQYIKYGEYTKGLILAMQIRDNSKLKEIFEVCKDR